jgi:general secretion pathway protein C
MSLLGDVPVVTKPAAVAEAPPDDGKDKDDLQAAIDSGIKKIDDSNYEIDRALVDKVLANPMAIAKGARVVPAVKNGKADGFRLYAIRPSSVYSKLGFSNGDTLHSINGFELTSADKALEVYTKLKEANSLQIEVTRRGKPVTINYSIK